uniref:hypothetical protein n=1 Tax=Euplotes cristatus TaxID=756077 RepID=UPI002E780310|nr:hypothetical protein V3A03_mgp11 [Euplotes cristatus]UPM52081.1 hypothetical protein [Euplotes cristatus]
MFFSMVTKYLSRPNNVLINRLGLGAPWKVPSAFNPSLKRFFFLFRIFFSRFFFFLWSSGALHSNHLFAGRFFHTVRYAVLPFVSSLEANKYFRLVRIRFSARFRSRRFFITRKYLHFLNLGEFFFYRVGNLLLILIFAHIPEPLKRKSFLADYLGLGSAGVTLRKGVRTVHRSALSGGFVRSFFSRILGLL